MNFAVMPTKISRLLHSLIQQDFSSLLAWKKCLTTPLKGCRRWRTVYTARPY